MSVRSHIEDGQGTSTLAKVTPNNALRVSAYPPISAAGLTADELTNVKFYQEFFSNSAGATDMNVDGSVTAVDFEIQSELNLVKWISEFRINIEGEQFEISTNDFRRGCVSGAPQRDRDLHCPGWRSDRHLKRAD